MGTSVDYRIDLRGNKGMMQAVAADLATAAGFGFDKEAFEQSGCFERDDCAFDVRWCGSDDTPELEVHFYMKGWASTEEAFHETSGTLHALIVCSLMTLLVFFVLGALGWAIWRGQFEDVEREGQRIFEND